MKYVEGPIPRQRSRRNPGSPTAELISEQRLARLLQNNRLRSNDLPGRPVPGRFGHHRE